MQSLWLSVRLPATASVAPAVDGGSRKRPRVCRFPVATPKSVNVATDITKIVASAHGATAIGWARRVTTMDSTDAEVPSPGVQQISDADRTARNVKCCQRA